MSVVELEEVMTILELHQQWLSISAIAARPNMDRKTVQDSGDSFAFPSEHDRFHCSLRCRPSGAHRRLFTGEVSRLYSAPFPLIPLAALL
jgi:hypothetical protein